MPRVHPESGECSRCIDKSEGAILAARLHLARFIC